MRHHIAISRTAAQIASIISGSTAVPNTWYYDTDNDLMYYSKLSDNKLIGPIPPVAALQAQSFTRSVDNTANRVIEIADMTAAQGALSVRVSVTINEAGTQQTAVYDISRANVTVTTTYFNVLPTNSSATPPIRLQVRNITNGIRLRLKRYTSTATASVNIRIENQSSTALSITSQSATTTDATAQIVYADTQIGQSNNRVGIGIHPNDLPTDAAHGFAGLTHFADSLFIDSAVITGASRPWMRLPLAADFSARDQIVVRDGTTNRWKEHVAAVNTRSQRRINDSTGHHIVEYMKEGTSAFGGIHVEFIARRVTGASTVSAIGNNDRAYAFTNNQDPIIQLYGDRRVQMNRYTSTQDDTGTQSVDNVLYTGTTGMMYSAPVGYAFGRPDEKAIFNATAVALDRNTLVIVLVDDDVNATVNLPNTGLVTGDKVLVKFANTGTNNTLTVAGNGNDIDISLTSVSITKNTATLFVWMGTGATQEWHRLLSFNP